ncbi:MAG: NADH-quinone oxidoreductase subunit L [SAR202 cluster bacterium]|nr:NADH-quinone oxidoreductase subunit L [SAR202 cluster bacterium]
MIPESAALLIFLLPLAAFLVNGLIVRPFFNRYSQVAGYVTILAIGVAFGLSLWALKSVVDNDGAALPFDPHPWLEIGAFNLEVGILLDSLTAIMLVVVTGVSFLVQIYSTGYMKGDPGYARYFAYMSLFTASMVGLVIADNIIQVFFFWELVGLCSFLLIGFWYHQPSAAAAAKKAFLVTRLGDFGFLLGILYLFTQVDVFSVNGMNVLNIHDINEAAKGGLLATSVSTWVALGFFMGAVGKSGQFPLHTWLPDAMEGPTPVSSLIHAATMVAAGVFLVGRFFEFFEASKSAMQVVAIIGGFTAVFAASMGLVANDIKRVLAYSTVSQLGYMMMALGVGAYGAAIFHLFTHAFFKCLLFQGSGSVNHAAGTFDMRFMGGLRKHMPWTYITFLIGSLSLAGIAPLSGFWSKDEILSHSLGHFVFYLGLAAAFMTAFYMFRALFLTFHGEFRGGADAEKKVHAHAAPSAGHAAGHTDDAHGKADEHQEHHVHLAESPISMVAPMIVLAVLAVGIGYLVNPVWSDIGPIPKHWFSHFLHAETEDFNYMVAGISTAVAVAGIALAYVMYMKKALSPSKLASTFRPVYTVLLNKYYFDTLYEDIIVRKLFYRGLVNALDWTDKNVVDGTVRFIDKVGRNAGGLIGHVQTGQLQGYGLVISVGVLAMLGIYLATYFW